jgi:hypothetical protein
MLPQQSKGIIFYWFIRVGQSSDFLLVMGTVSKDILLVHTHLGLVLRGTMVAYLHSGTAVSLSQLVSPSRLSILALF